MMAGCWWTQEGSHRQFRHQKKPGRVTAPGKPSDDFPGCVATGATIEEVEEQFRGAIEFHLEGIREDGLEVPRPQSKVEYIEVAP